MSARAVIGLFFPLVGCAAHHPVGDSFPVADAPPETPYAQPAGPSLVKPDPQPTQLASGPDAGSVDPSCAAIAMADGAPSTTCSATSFAFAGGTIAPGTYALKQWADDASSCVDPSNASVRRATMSVEQRADGAIVLRWIRDVDGVTSSGAYRLATHDDARLDRIDICSNTAPTLVSFTATDAEIDIAWSAGQETWTLLP